MASKKFYVPLGLASLASDPASGSEGELYYNSISDTVKVYKNSAWTDLISSGNLPSGGATGQILAKSSNTDYAVEWIENYANYTETVKVRVKNDGTRPLYQGQPVYVTGSDGTNVLIGRASSATESGSSKTLGLLEQNLTENGQGFVIKEGKLGGLDTSSAGAVGDPVWLGADGTLIYGLTNKPYAPTHLVYIGVVTKKNGSTGEIFVTVQNGFELHELHNVQITEPETGNTIVYDAASSLWKDAKVVNSIEGFTGDITGSNIISAISTVDGSGSGLDADKLDGHDSTYFSVSTHNHDTLYQPVGSYLTSETDPVFTASEAYNITSTDTSHWDTAHGWGDHSIAGYLTSSSASSTYATISSLSSYLTTANASATYLSQSSAASTYQPIGDYQPLDLDLSAIAAISSTSGLLKKTAANTWELDTTTYATSTDISNAIGDYIPLSQKGYAQGVAELDIDGYVPASQLNLTDYLTTSSASSTYQPLDADLTAISALTGTGLLKRTGSNTWSLDTNTYLTSYTETDTLDSVASRGSWTSSNIDIGSNMASSSPWTGALTVTGGVGIGEDLYVNNNVYIGGNIDITGTITGSLTLVDVTNLSVTDPLIYLAEGNTSDAVDIGIFAALNHGGPSYEHTGLIRDASDSGIWKLVSGLDDPTANVIDFTGATYDTLKIGALEVTDSSTTRTNLGLAIGTDIQAYSSNLNIAANPSQYGYDTGKTLIAAFDGTISWEMRYSLPGNPLTVGPGKLLVTGNDVPPSWLSPGTAGQVLKVNATADGLEWGTASGSSFTNSSELAALLSDETGTGYVVFSDSPTFTGTVSGITSSMVGLGNVENIALSTWTGSTNITTVGDVSANSLNIDNVTQINTATTTISSAAATAIFTDTTAYSTSEYTVQAQFTKSFTVSSVTASSPSAGSATYTATGHNFVAGDIVVITGASVAGYNGTFTITAVATNTFTVANATTGATTWSSGNATSKYYRSSKIMLAQDGVGTQTSLTNFTEYAILEYPASAIPVTFSATSTSGVVTLKGAFTGWTSGYNITVKVVRNGIV